MVHFDTICLVGFQLFKGFQVIDLFKLKLYFSNTKTILTCYATFIVVICLNFQDFLHRTQIGWYLLSIRPEVMCSSFDRQRSIAIKLHCTT